MENSLNNQPNSFAAPGEPKKSGAVKFLKLFFVLLVLGVVAYFGWSFYKDYKVSQVVPKVFQVGGDVDFKVVKAEAMPIMKFESNETLAENAVVYTENKYQFEVLKDFYDRIVSGEWAAVDGSKQEGDKSIFKVVDSTGTLMFIYVEGGLNEPSTSVKIYKVYKNVN